MYHVHNRYIIKCQCTVIFISGPAGATRTKSRERHASPEHDNGRPECATPDTQLTLHERGAVRLGRPVRAPRGTGREGRSVGQTNGGGGVILAT